MIIKKFQAKTENDAVEIAKKELGSGTDPSSFFDYAIGVTQSMAF